MAKVPVATNNLTQTKLNVNMFTTDLPVQPGDSGSPVLALRAGKPVLVGLVSYYLGRAAAEAINRYGLIAGVAIVALLVLGALVFRFIRRRMMEAEPEA